MVRRQRRAGRRRVRHAGRRAADGRLVQVVAAARRRRLAARVIVSVCVVRERHRERGRMHSFQFKGC